MLPWAAAHLYYDDGSWLARSGLKRVHAFRLKRPHRRTSEADRLADVQSGFDHPAMRVPPPVAVDLHAPALDFFKQRVAQAMFDTYAGLPMLKFPEDLRAYEHIIWSERVQVVVELGTQHGGSTLWFRDRLLTLARYGRILRPRVITVDIGLSDARAHLPQVDPAYENEITLIEGDVLETSTTDRVRALVQRGASCLVVEDLAHTYDTTMAFLQAFSSLIKPGGFFIVEDGCVDIEEMRLHPDWPRGALTAVREWLSTSEGRDFRQRRDRELYGISSNPEGFLQRVPGTSAE